MVDNTALGRMSPETVGVALVLMGVIGEMIKSGALDRAAVAGLPARMDASLAAAGRDEAYRERAVEIMRALVPPESPPRKSDP